MLRDQAGSLDAPSSATAPKQQAPFQRSTSSGDYFADTRLPLHSPALARCWGLQVRGSCRAARAGRLGDGRWCSAARLFPRFPFPFAPPPFTPLSALPSPLPHPLRAAQARVAARLRQVHVDPADGSMKARLRRLQNMLLYGLSVDVHEVCGRLVLIWSMMSAGGRGDQQ